MVKVVFGSEISPPGGWRLHFSNSLQTHTATRLDEVLPLLEFAETQAHLGHYVAIMISYEAGPAFDVALSAHAPSELPLAWVAVFREVSDCETQGRGDWVSSVWTPKIDKNEYESAVTKIRELIAAGDTYQVNYSFPLISTFSEDPYQWYRELCMAQGAQYCAYFDLGRFQVLSLSPELFFERRGDHVRTKPMKGTVRRGRWAAEDEELAQWLQHSAKDRAENIMIVDLLRNDLGKVSLPGSVHVSSMYQAERYETVWQMTSTVESTLRPQTSVVELMSALFPCGSITGAPKIRTTQIIRDLERFPRGVYTGALGVLFPGGDCVFNVAIRTVVIDRQTGAATFGVGGGVTIDSTADKEYEECLVKSRFLQSRPEEFELFETMLVEDDAIFLLERHLERLKRSAAYFGFEFKKEEILKMLNPIPSLTAKLKLSLRKDGRVEIEAVPLNHVDRSRVGLATAPVDSADRFLFHKTTRRDFYNTQLQLQPHCDDIIFWNERGEITESTIANVVVSINDQLYTPPIDCGLLAGTFRDHLLAEGRIKERVITIEELQNAKQVFLINSVRKWMNAVCVNECSSVAQL
ncbi:MAG TPA: aminodeoxychorismate synthase component I [Pyrinomonadaceae bacterium]|nr:aminodeoxychorismate synthase component I [Pyrinomonadaceae bacterium]